MALPPTRATDPPTSHSAAVPASYPTTEADSLAARLAEDMADRWFNGERPRAEEYLDRHPQLWDRPEAAAQLVYEEVCLRQEHLPGAKPADVLDRFPQWRAQLQVLLDCHRMLQADGPPAPDFPSVGETLGDFRLVAELGRGAVGRVFLASQLSLNGRPVVLKLSPCTTDEHQELLSLARLQHTYIVPLYSAQDYPERHVRALCLPYFGGVTLDRLFERLRDRPPAQRSGKDLLAALDQTPPAPAAGLPPRGPERQRLAGVSYVDAVCILGLCLADALEYAHQRDLVHLDVKPANVLLAADGKPMLLDFHLAQPPIPADGPPPRRLGGTPLYMSPEQERALTAVRGRQPLPAAVDGRSDVYALGLLLYQALGGPLPVNLRAPSQLRHYNPQVSVGLADVLHRCMAAEARDRYPDAAALAADLDRHLNHLPLRGVRNRSGRERWAKWRRRRPLGVAWVLIVCMTLAAGLTLGSVWHQRRQEARAALEQGQKYLEAGDYAQAVPALEHGRNLAQDLRFSPALAQEIDAQLRLARRGLDAASRAEAARKLHDLADQLRFRYLARGLSAAELREVAVRCRSLWDLRGAILERTADGDTPPDARAEQLKADLRDLGIIWADLCVRLGLADSIEASRRAALGTLVEAEELFGPSAVLDHERRAIAGVAGGSGRTETAGPVAAERAPRTAWEHSALGRLELQQGDLARAATAFEQALELEPQGFWPNFHQGLCAYRLQRYDEALAAFRTCVALRPDTAWCFHNRALVYEALGRDDRALKDYSRALTIDPEMAAALLNRGILHSRAKRYDAALDDLRDAWRLGADKAAVQRNRELIAKARKGGGS